MSTAAEIVAALRASPAVVALVDDRIYGGEIPPGKAEPAIRYFRIGGEPDHYTVDRVRGPIVARYQIEAWAGDYTTMRELAEATREAVEDLESPLIAGTFYTAERESFDAPSRQHGCALEFDMHERR